MHNKTKNDCSLKQNNEQSSVFHRQIKANEWKKKNNTHQKLKCNENIKIWNWPPPHTPHTFPKCMWLPHCIYKLLGVETELWMNFINSVLFFSLSFFTWTLNIVAHMNRKWILVYWYRWKIRWNFISNTFHLPAIRYLQFIISDRPNGLRAPIPSKPT